MVRESVESFCRWFFPGNRHSQWTTKTQNNTCTWNTKINKHKKLSLVTTHRKLQNRGLVAFYDILPGNGAGLFLQPSLEALHRELATKTHYKNTTLKKDKSEHLYSALHSIQTTLKALRHGSHSFTCNKHQTCRLHRKHSPDGASTDWGGKHLIAAHYSFIDPERMKGWVCLIGLLVHTMNICNVMVQCCFSKSVQSWSRESRCYRPTRTGFVGQTVFMLATSAESSPLSVMSPSSTLCSLHTSSTQINYGTTHCNIRANAGI